MFEYFIVIPNALKTVVPKPVHCVPFDEYTMVFVPYPTAIHKLDPLLSTAYPKLVNTVDPKPVHCVPLEL